MRFSQKDSLKIGICPPDIKKVLFLDIDGVLCPHKDRRDSYQIEDSDLPAFYEKFKTLFNIDYSKYKDRVFIEVYYDWDKKSIALLKDVLNDTGTKIILSSEWRICGFQMMYDYFTLHGLQEYYIGDTRYLDYSSLELLEKKYNKMYNANINDFRTIEILDFLNNNPHITTYAVVDDLSLNPVIKDHFVKTSFKLYTKDAEQLKKILSE
ncbi:MAG: hypothetical protein LBF22_08505 [Deltaproteobacteria bacterium]|jgi:hypothetical protein|nr:hypothetical protein [Deltaproteobacteria bacterium]